jgi:hypothetical protein
VKECAGRPHARRTEALIGSWCRAEMLVKSVRGGRVRWRKGCLFEF